MPPSAVAHRANTVDSSPTAYYDPKGLSHLRRTDILRQLVQDEGGEIDASGKLPGGETFSGPQGLKKLLLSRSDEFARATVERLLTYGLGRELDARDQPAVREIVRSTEAKRYPFLDLVAAIVKSVPFQMRQTQGL